MRKIPVKFEDYTHSMVRSDYVLSDGDKFMLNGFLEYYDGRKDELDDVCTLIKPDDLKKALDEATWMDTNVMYYYFEILRLGCDSRFNANLSVYVSTIYTLVGSILYNINIGVATPNWVPHKRKRA